MKEIDKFVLRKEETYGRNVFGINNKGVVIGRVVDEPEISCVKGFKGERLYKTRLEVGRKNSSKKDYIPVVIPEKQMKDVVENSHIEVLGEFRAYMRDERKYTFLYAKKVNTECKESETNRIYLGGYICNKPYCKEINGSKIVSFCLAVHRQYYDKTDYVQCIAWKEKADWILKQSVGQKISIYGRVRNREFPKIVGKDTEFIKVYEVSAITLKTL